MTVTSTEVPLEGVLLITGGTGSFGHAVLKRFMDSNLDEIRIFSRDEKKQDDMRKRYSNSKLKFYIGDVRDRHSLASAFRGVNHCFHAAALKQVPSCEFHPMEAVRTNIIGTENVIDAAVAAGVARLICLSTDKAVYPIKSGQPMTVTDPAMTRFMMSLGDAVDLVLYAFQNAGNGDLFVQKAPATTLEVLAKAMGNVLGRADYPVREIGTRHGEKLFESLLSREEYATAQDLGEYFRILPDGRDLNYEKYVEEGEDRITVSGDYNSHNTRQLDLGEMSQLLHGLPFIQRVLRGESGTEY